jgi:hypothetical protein
VPQNFQSCSINPIFRNLEDTAIPIYKAKAHKEIVNCIDGVGGLGIGEGAPEIATGSRDGNDNTVKLAYIGLDWTSIFCLLGHMFFICWFMGPPTWNSGISEKNKN